MVNNFTEIAFLNILLFIDNIVKIIFWYLHITNFVFITLFLIMIYHVFIVDRLTNLVNTADQRIEEAKQSGEGKVDKLVSISYIYKYY